MVQKVMTSLNQARPVVQRFNMMRLNRMRLLAHSAKVIMSM